MVDAVRRPVGVSRAPPNNPRVMPSHMSPHGQVRMDQWPPHPSHFPSSHSQGMAMFNNPAHQQANSSFMSLPGQQQYRSHRSYTGGDQYIPPRSPDGN